MRIVVSENLKGVLSTDIINLIVYQYNSMDKKSNRIEIQLNEEIKEGIKYQIIKIYEEGIYKDIIQFKSNTPIILDITVVEDDNRILFL